MIPIKSPALICYNAKIAEDVNFDLNEFLQILKSVLQDPKGWRSYGYEFVEGNNEKAVKKVEILLCTDKYVKKTCNTINLSCYDPQTDKIYLNFNNWQGGSKSDLPINRYREYVINHEMGHALGFEHTKCPKTAGNKASVMQQMSKGPDHIKPCVSNEWPLPYPLELELQGKYGGAFNHLFHNMCPDICYNYWFLIILICVIIIIIVARNLDPDIWGKIKKALNLGKV